MFIQIDLGIPAMQYDLKFAINQSIIEVPSFSLKQVLQNMSRQLLTTLRQRPMLLNMSMNMSTSIMMKITCQ